MIKEPINKYSGISMSEDIVSIPKELTEDIIGFWTIVGSGRDSYGLQEDKLVDYVRRCLMTIFQAGAKPLISPYVGLTNPIDRYGDTPETMTEAIIKEWLASGKDPEYDDIWFGLPKFFNHNFNQKSQ